MCTSTAGYSLQELHRKSCQMLKQELNQIGFGLGNEGDLERVLYPHYLSHPIGIGQFFAYSTGGYKLIREWAVDLHESSHIDRSAP